MLSSSGTAARKETTSPLSIKPAPSLTFFSENYMELWNTFQTYPSAQQFSECSKATAYSYFHCPRQSSSLNKCKPLAHNNATIIPNRSLILCCYIVLVLTVQRNFPIPLEYLEKEFHLWGEPRPPHRHTMLQHWADLAQTFPKPKKHQIKC